MFQMLLHVHVHSSYAARQLFPFSHSLLAVASSGMQVDHGMIIHEHVVISETSAVSTILLSISIHASS